jgi:predicted signal transduction protein with EAL and GGDEF domain
MAAPHRRNNCHTDGSLGQPLCAPLLVPIEWRRSARLCFVARLPHDASAEALIAEISTLCDQLDIAVVAEGIETLNQGTRFVPSAAGSVRAA